MLRTNRKWVGSSKWLIRSLREFDATFSMDFVEAFDTFYQKNDKAKIIDLVDLILRPYGGRLFDGFSIGK
ncbi:hypothetical protein ACFSCX_12930 [Bacillus salitolerans]|uniref:Uncharacterized protein n=1 Tax=Bacillus salitolerans TaxID=1437434 RepID=A0ABW4LQL5_9BACI